MSGRRSLIEGLKEVSLSADPGREKDFVYGTSPRMPAESSPSPSPTSATTKISRAPVSTKIRSDFASALKRASLERQLKGVEPSTLQDILEEAIEPWLRANGYLS